MRNGDIQQPDSGDRGSGRVCAGRRYGADTCGRYNDRCKDCKNRSADDKSRRHTVLDRNTAAAEDRGTVVCCGHTAYGQGQDFSRILSGLPCGLEMEADHGGAGLGEPFNVLVRLDYHQMDVHGLPGDRKSVV